MIVLPKGNGSVIVFILKHTEVENICCFDLGHSVEDRSYPMVHIILNP